jgi:hypothetical protein
MNALSFSFFPDDEQHYSICLEFGLDKKLHDLVMNMIYDLSPKFLDKIAEAIFHICWHGVGKLNKTTIGRVYATLFKLITCVEDEEEDVLYESTFALIYLFKNEHARELVDSAVRFCLS